MGSRETLEFIVTHLVDHPDEVSVEEVDADNGTVYELFVHPDDIGRVIGRSGRTARAIRTVVKAAGMQEDRNVLVDIMD